MKIIFLLLLLINTIDSLGQKKIHPQRLTSEFAKGENKEKYYRNLTKNAYTIIDGNFRGNSKAWIEAFNDLQSILAISDTLKQGLRTILELRIDSEIKLQRTALETAYTLYPGVFYDEILRISENTNDKISFAIAVNYLRNKYSTENLMKLVLSRFPQSSGDALIDLLINDLKDKKPEKPSFNDLFEHHFQKGKTIVFSIFRKNREFPGITVIKGPDGKFLRNDNGSFFNIPQLALSFSNLPSYIPNGNTPQGIYSIIGTYISPTETIGPTPNLLVRTPFEVSTKIFYHGKVRNTSWDLEDYKSLLPESWQSFDPIFNSFNAGKIGRRLIIVHGSTDETEYFSDKIYYPLIPTRGCLSSKEIWDDSGKLIESDQVKLINAFRSAGSINGFLVVIEIDDNNAPVNIEDIERYMR